MQTGLIYYAPRCAPAWDDGADNGGATYRGVTADTITVLVFREAKNEIVSTILEPEGLRATREQEVAFMDAAEIFLNTHYEFFGRTLDLVMFDAPSCPETTPDVPACKEAAREAAAQDPFAVLWMVPSYPEVFDEWVREGIISVGGWHFDDSYFTGRRPYRYDPFMDGTQTADFIAEYYCTKMANQMATHSGAVIHSSYPNGGARGQVPRRVGIVTPDLEANILAAERVKSLIAACDATEPVVVGYDPDPTRGAQQAGANTTAFIDAQVTTVICMCDPIAPVFRTNNMTRNAYFPEFLLPGSGLLDYDKLGRLYDRQQMAHAFGPSHLNQPVDHSESDASIAWNEAGNSGDACGACNLPWTYYQLLGAMLQSAGPNLTPATVEQGMLNLPDRGGWAESGGDPRRPLSRYGVGDYTGISDMREVYWDANATSRLDGRPGAYVPMNDGTRYEHGQIPAGLDVPVAPS